MMAYRVEKSPVRIFLFGLVGVVLLLASVDIVWGHWLSTVPEVSEEGVITTRGRSQRRADFVWGAALFVGDKGMVLADYGKHVLLPEKDFVDFKRPEPWIPKSLGHHAEWLHACKTGEPTTCNFEYSGWLTEANHLGNVAFRVGKKLQWDPVNLRATNAPEADPLIRREYRPGWKLG